MIKRYLLASVTAVVIVVAVVLVDGLVAELTGLSLPGEVPAALAFFLAFYLAGRIGGKGFFWIGIAVFAVIKILSLSLVLDVVGDLQAIGGSTVPDATWASVIATSWLSILINLAATILGLFLGAGNRPKPVESKA